MDITDIYKKMLPWRKHFFSTQSKPEVLKVIERGNVTLDEYLILCDAFGTNSYERELIYNAMTDEALTRITESLMRQIAPYSYYKPASTYEELVLHILVPELIKRLQDAKSTVSSGGG